MVLHNRSRPAELFSMTQANQRLTTLVCIAFAVSGLGAAIAAIAFRGGHGRQDSQSGNSKSPVTVEQPSNTADSAVLGGIKPVSQSAISQPSPNFITPEGATRMSLPPLPNSVAVLKSLHSLIFELNPQSVEDFHDRLRPSIEKYLSQFEITSRDQWKIDLVWRSFENGVVETAGILRAQKRLGGKPLGGKENSELLTRAFGVPFESQIMEELLRRLGRDEDAW